MGEKLTKASTMHAINGGANKLGVVVSLTPLDVPSLSSEAAKTRLEAANYGATAIVGRLGTIRATAVRAAREMAGGRNINMGRILLATRASGTDVLEQEAGVLDAKAEGVNAIAVGSSKASDHITIFRGIREDLLRAELEIPLFSFVDTGSTEELAVRDAVERGSDAVVVDHSLNFGKLVDASYPSVPVYSRLDSGHSSPVEILTKAAQARDAGAAGVVVGRLNLSDGARQLKLSHMIRGISDVVREGNSPEEAYRVATRGY
jgi:hypothetical protein